MRQLVLGLTTPHTLGTWLPTAGTAAAWQAVQVGGPRLVCLYGPAGGGKSHLLQHAAALGSVVADNLESLTRTQQEALFHACNSAARIAVASAMPVAQTEGLVADLHSRLLTGTQLEVLPPTEPELQQLLALWAQQRQLTLPPVVTDYLLSRASRSTHVLAQLVSALDTLSLEQKRAVTIPLARQVLQQAGVL